MYTLVVRKQNRRHVEISSEALAAGKMSLRQLQVASPCGTQPNVKPSTVLLVLIPLVLLPLDAAAVHDDNAVGSSARAADGGADGDALGTAARDAARDEAGAAVAQDTAARAFGGCW